MLDLIKTPFDEATRRVPAGAGICKQVNMIQRNKADSRSSSPNRKGNRDASLAARESLAGPLKAACGQCFT